MSARRTRLGRLVGGSLRAPLAAFLFVVVFLVRADARIEIRLIGAWDAYAAVWHLLAWLTIVRAGPAETRDWQRGEGGTRSRLASLLRGGTVDLASIVAISLLGLLFGSVLLTATEPPLTAADRETTVLSALAIVLAWLALNTSFELYYAALHYREVERTGGLSFPGDEAPDLLDFAHFAVTVGTTFAASDVSVVGRRMRRPVLVHALLPFTYNTGVLGLVVNIALVLS